MDILCEAFKAYIQEELQKLRNDLRAEMYAALKEHAHRSLSIAE